MGDFLLVVIELFFARCFRFVTIHVFDRQTDRQTDIQTDGRTDGENLDRNTVRIYASQSHGKKTENQKTKKIIAVDLFTFLWYFELNRWSFILGEFFRPSPAPCSLVPGGKTLCHCVLIS